MRLNFATKKRIIIIYYGKFLKMFAEFFGDFLQKGFLGRFRKHAPDANHETPSTSCASFGSGRVGGSRGNDNSSHRFSKGAATVLCLGSTSPSIEISASPSVALEMTVAIFR